MTLSIQKIKNIKYCGALLVNKPKGLSSTSLVGLLKKKLQFKTIGHTGILDQAAEGLMLLLLGRATSLAQFFIHADKEYISTFKLGMSTDTFDKEGNITASIDEMKVRIFMRDEKEKIISNINSFLNLNEQIPPIYSALKINGKRSSDLARAGKKVELKSRSINIYECEVLNYDIENCLIQVRLRVSGGTYVRALARDLGVSLDIPVYLYSLKRIGLSFLFLNNETLQVKNNEISGNENSQSAIENLILSPQSILPDWAIVKIKKDEYEEKIKKGIILPITYFEGVLPNRIGQYFFIENRLGVAIAWAKRSSGSYRYGRVLV